MELFDRYNERLWLYCARMSGDPQQANDIAQELWEKVIRLRGKDIAPPAKPGSYLFAAARNLCLNHFRSRRDVSSIDDIAESEHPRDHIREKSDLEELMATALGRLPASQREVLVLNAYSGYGFDEIAELLGRPAGAIHTTAWRARKRLGEILSDLMKGEEQRTGIALSNDYRNNHRTEPE